MSTPFLCVFLAYLLIYAPRLVVAAAQARQPEGFDNQHPRDQQSRLQGWGRRANAAHANAFEAFAPFAAAVALAHLAHADPTWTSRLAVTFVAARTLYPALYIGNLSSLRTLVWGVGALATGVLFILAL